MDTNNSKRNKMEVLKDATTSCCNAPVLTETIRGISTAKCAKCSHEFHREKFNVPIKVVLE